MQRIVLSEVSVEEVDGLIYGELMALYASASSLDVDGPYVFIAYDGNLYIGEHDEHDEFRIYRVLGAKRSQRSKLYKEAIGLNNVNELVSRIRRFR
jgi:hypothetical protein